MRIAFRLEQDPEKQNATDFAGAVAQLIDATDMSRNNKKLVKTGITALDEYLSYMHRTFTKQAMKQRQELRAEQLMNRPLKRRRKSSS